MSTAMLNVRMDKGLKAKGEQVLARQGITATEAVRSLYRYMEKHDEVPDFCWDEVERVSSETRRQNMRALIGIAPLAPGEELGTLKAERLSRLGV